MPSDTKCNVESLPETEIKRLRRDVLGEDDDG